MNFPFLKYGYYGYYSFWSNCFLAQQIHFRSTWDKLAALKHWTQYFIVTPIHINLVIHKEMFTWIFIAFKNLIIRFQISDSHHINYSEKFPKSCGTKAITCFYMLLYENIQLSEIFKGHSTVIYRQFCTRNRFLAGQSLSFTASWLINWKASYLGNETLRVLR